MIIENKNNIPPYIVKSVSVVIAYNVNAKHIPTVKNNDINTNLGSDIAHIYPINTD